ncbi:MAG TPA: MazG family protein [Acidimicrobiales bacterium]
MGGDAGRPRVTALGLGPAGPSYLTGQVVALMAGAPRAFLRTARHPAAASLVGVESLDHLYETAGTFEEVYRAIVEVVVGAAIEHAPVPIVYAVPGSPLVAERTVELLREDARVELDIVPALSFLDLAWGRLGIDPLREEVRLVDAASFASGSRGETGPFLVAQCWSQAVLSDIKLSVAADDVDPPDAILLHHLGLDDEQVRRVNWWELDRTVAPDHLTSVYVPGAAARADVGGEMVRLQQLVATLRARCPWDRAQSHASLMPHLLEESYEVLDAIDALDALAVDDSFEHLSEELGDLLFQIVFHACLAQEEGRFDLASVVRGVHDKLVHRHPHVFGEVSAETPEQVVANWEEIKKLEKGRSSVTEGIPKSLPSLLLSTKLQRKALSVGLPVGELDDTAAPLLASLVARLPPGGDERAGASDEPLASDSAELEDLMGQLLFEVANVCRQLGVDPEHALRTTALSFGASIVAQESAATATATAADD